MYANFQLILFFVNLVYVINSYSIYNEAISTLVYTISGLPSFHCQLDNEVCLDNPAAYSSFGRQLSDIFGYPLSYEKLLEQASLEIRIRYQYTVFQGVIESAKLPNNNVMRMWDYWTDSKGL